MEQLPIEQVEIEKVKTKREVLTNEQIQAEIDMLDEKRKELSAQIKKLRNRLNARKHKAKNAKNL